MPAWFVTLIYCLDRRLNDVRLYGEGNNWTQFWTQTHRNAVLRAVTRWTLHCQKTLQNKSDRHLVVLSATTTIEDDVRYRSKATHGPAPPIGV
jgi:hypothetical protein